MSKTFPSNRFGFFVALLLALTSSLRAQQVDYTPYAFTTIAGMASIGSHDGPGSAARFNEPESCVTDQFGNIYVADTDNNCIRCLMSHGSTNWVVSTIAGLSGSAGFADGLDSGARFNRPEGIAIDKFGVLYVADSGNFCIRKIVSHKLNVWTVTTIAGRPGFYGNQDGTNQDAAFDDPFGICVDLISGNIFVTDYANDEIREIAPSGTNWVVTTIAGNGYSGHADGLGTNATFFYPSGITADLNHNLFVSDGLNYTIRKMTPSGQTWTTSTIAGQVGVDDGGDGLGTNAQFEFPVGIVADTNGNVFVADAEGYTLRELSPNGTNYLVTTILGRHRVAGTNDGVGDAARLNGPYGLCRFNTGNLIIADTGNSEIRQAIVDGTNWVSTTLAGFGGDEGSADGTNSAARFDRPFGIAVDVSTNLYVADNFNSTIRKITPSGTNWIVTTIAGQPGYAQLIDGLGTNAAFSYPDGVAVDSNGVVYVADSGNAAIRRLAPVAGSYQVTTIAGSNGYPGSADGTNLFAQFHNPSGIAVDSSGVLYLADCFNSTIRKITPSGTNWITTTIAGSAGVYGWAEGSGTNAVFNDPRGVAVDKNGVVYVTDWVNYVIRMLTPDGATYDVTTIAGTPHLYGHSDGTNSDASFAYPTHIAVDANGILYVTDCNNSTLRKIVHNGAGWVVTTMGGVPNQNGSADGVGPSALFNYPQGIAVHPGGVVYLTEEFNSTVVRGVALPVIVVSDPTVSGGLLQVPFFLQSGSASAFTLLQSASLGAPWAANPSAVLSTVAQGVAYKFTVPLPSAAQFYLIQVP